MDTSPENNPLKESGPKKAFLAWDFVVNRASVKLLDRAT
jgi:hypothetical protein